MAVLFCYHEPMQTKSGRPVHPIGIGTWNVSSHINPENAASKYKGVEPVYGNEEAEIEGLRYSISKGQNHIDCAELYGGFYTDEVVGRAIAGLKREDLYIADKLWKTSVGEGQVRPAVNEMLRKLGTDYLDMLYIHAPWDGIDWPAAIPQIDQLIDEGVVRQFGVSNFTINDMEKARSLAKHPIAANQMEFNVLYKDEVNQEFRDYCEENSILIVAYQPLRRQEVLQDKTIQEIATAHNATPAQIALAWLISLKALPIPKAINKQHIDENLGALNIKLSQEELEILDDL